MVLLMRTMLGGSFHKVCARSNALFNFRIEFGGEIAVGSSNIELSAPTISAMHWTPSLEIMGGKFGDLVEAEQNRFELSRA